MHVNMSRSTWIFRCLDSGRLGIKLNRLKPRGLEGQGPNIKEKNICKYRLLFNVTITYNYYCYISMLCYLKDNDASAVCGLGNTNEPLLVAQAFRKNEGGQAKMGYNRNDERGQIKRQTKSMMVRQPRRTYTCFWNR